MIDTIDLKLFQEQFSQLDQEVITHLTEHGQIRQWEEGEVMMRTGQYIKQTMLILDGRVKLYRESEDGSEFFIYYLEPGQACALSMICSANSEPSQITAKAVSPTRTLVVPVMQTEVLFGNNRSWYNFVLKNYRSRFDEMLQVLDSVAFRGMDERLEFYLKRHFDAEGDILNTTHQEIAADLSTSREVISRLLKKMEKEGYIALQRNQIINKKL
ncbi:Crp/Fnr family transcriptional regulator [Eisenibacter elegans]|jgi:CRP/FNR family transcriptional regulator|uniref:Crp/Fnr family transcriptional regulator n=1 Tax=Eisenibacter elegans TaxID=997 RepID=UPI00041E832B|nr:Crp/Fnr family transcriptional regulator [Eisenibacter elegans]